MLAYQIQAQFHFFPVAAMLTELKRMGTLGSMKALPPRVKRLAKPVRACSFVLEWTSEGKRHRRFFRSWAEADRACRALKQRARIAGEGALGIQPGDAEALSEAKQLLSPFDMEPLAAVKEWVEAKRLLQSCGGNVLDAARELAERRTRETASLPMEQAYERFLEYKEAAKLRPRAIASLRSDLSRFVNAFSGRLVSSLSAADISDYVAARGELEPLTRLSILRRVGAFINWCGKRGWCEKGIMADIEKPKVRGAQTHIFTPDEARALLEAASNVAPEMVPYLALGLFCGLRTAELDRLDWRYINGEVRIEADVAKTASRRVVPIPENAAAWIAPYRKKSGSVRPPNSRRMLDRVIEAAGVSWKPNAMRHSFASYRLAQCNDAPRVSLELGHMSPAIVFRHYRALVQEEEAKQFFEIRPAAEASNVISISAGQR